MERSRIPDGSTPQLTCFKALLLFALLHCFFFVCVFPLWAGSCWRRRSFFLPQSFVCSCTGTWHKTPTALGTAGCRSHVPCSQATWSHISPKLAFLLPEARGRKSWQCLTKAHVPESETVFFLLACQTDHSDSSCKLQYTKLFSLSRKCKWLWKSLMQDSSGWKFSRYSKRCFFFSWVALNSYMALYINIIFIILHIMLHAKLFV